MMGGWTARIYFGRSTRGTSEALRNKERAMRTHIQIVRSIVAAAALLAVAPIRAEPVTFEVHGHMVEAYASDFEVGDSFVADFTFDPTVPPNPNVPNETQYVSIT